MWHVSSCSGVAYCELLYSVYFLLFYFLLRGRRMQVGWVKIDEFRQVTGYISKTVKNRHIVSIKVE